MSPIRGRQLALLAVSLFAANEGYLKPVAVKKVLECASSV